jgi:hypothetical protein
MKREMAVVYFTSDEIVHECKGGVCMFRKEATVPPKYVTAIVDNTKTAYRTIIRWKYIKDQQITVKMSMQEVIKRLVKAMELNEKEYEKDMEID